MNSKNSYFQYSSLDLIPLQADQLERAVEAFNQLMAAASSQSTQQHVLIYCALGYSRSSAILCAWLMQQQHATQVNEAIQIVQSARPWVRLNDVQIKNLNTYQLKLKGSAP